MKPIEIKQWGHPHSSHQTIPRNSRKKNGSIIIIRKRLENHDKLTWRSSLVFPAAAREPSLIPPASLSNPENTSFLQDQMGIELLYFTLSAPYLL